MSDVSARLLCLAEVASWQVPDAWSRTSSAGPTIRAVLPALQRGSVWKPQQTEKLWDSILRGFPIGSFLFSPYDETAELRYGRQDFRLAPATMALEEAADNYTHHLLDGQQRATSIALGFYDIWEPESQERRKDGPVLWIDLDHPPEKDEREFVLRLVTRSHPWGYKRSNSEDRLEAREIRQALESFKRLAPAFQSASPIQFPLQHTWPWDAHAPIPMALLIKAIRSGATDVSAEVQKELTRLPFWTHANGDAAILGSNAKLRETLVAALNGTNESLKHRFDQIVRVLRPLVTENSSYNIPALILPKSLPISDEGIDQPSAVSERPDPVETLFIRINAGGTRLEGEELIYSLLKSAWKDAPQAIKDLQPSGHQIVTPARTVTLITRLLLARRQTRDDSGKFPNPPPAPEVAQFRRLVGDSDFKAELKTFVEGSARALFAATQSLLTLDPTNPMVDTHRLPPSLAANLAQGTVGADVMLLFLRWLDRMIVAGHDPLKLDIKLRKRLLGFLTALAWFSRDSPRCLRRLWPQLQTCVPEKLPDFFGHRQFASLVPPDPRAGLILLPIVPPEVLESVVSDRVTSGSAYYGGFRKPKHEFWRPGNDWQHYSSGLVTDEFKNLSGSLRSWLRSLPIKAAAANASDEDDGNEEGDGEQDGKELLRSAWDQFLDRLWTERRLLQYVQRDWIIRWFPDFDPTLPDQMEDINRPWDYDHVHPDNLVSGKHRIPSVVKEWHRSIGNLRIWPLELNRADQDSMPRNKLVEVGEPEKRYFMQKKEDLLAGSFIATNELHQWENSAPSEGFHRYLAQPLAQPSHHKYRMNLVRAITGRFCRIYREWYTTLRLGDL